jgi:hypothetical protein
MTERILAHGLIVLALLLSHLQVWPSTQVPPSASPGHLAAVLYHGDPEGMPRADDLATIKASGFDAVAWPSAYGSRRELAASLAAKVDLQFVEAPAPGASPAGVIRLDVSRRVRYVAADAWRAYQRGRKIVIFDPGDGPGVKLTDKTGGMRPWVEPARAFARQLTVNRLLFDRARPGTATLLSTGGADVTVSLFHTDRAWMLIATNTSARAGRLVARLPKAVPIALWTNMLDGSSMAMPRRAEGPTWTAEIGPGAALVYLIDRAEH